MNLTTLAEGQAMIVRVAESEPEVLPLPENTLEFYQKHVDGYIEVVSFSKSGKPYKSIFNEEGLIQNLPYNELASHYLGFAVVGNVVIINDSDLK